MFKRPILLLAAFTFFIAGLLLTPLAFGETAADFYYDGERSQSRGAYDKAIEAYTKAINLRPDYKNAYLVRARLYYITGRYDEAIADYGKLLTLNPGDQWMYIMRGAAHLKKGQLDLAIADASRAIAIKNNNSDYSGEAYLVRGAAHFGRKEYSLALADWAKGLYSNELKELAQPEEAFKKAVALNPNDPQLYFNLGEVHFFYSRYDQAIEAINRAVSLKPSYVEAYNLRALAYDARGQADLALRDMDRVIALKPDEIRAYELRGIIRFHKGHYNGALADFSTILTLMPDYVSAYTWRGETYEKLGRPDLALANYNKAITQDPNGYTTAYVDRGNLYLNKKQYDLAIADFNAVLTHRSNKEAYDGRATAYGAKGEYEKAIADWTAILQIYPEMAKELGPKIERAKGAMTSSGSRNYSSYISGGKAYLAMGKYDLALADFRGAITLAPSNNDARIWLAYTYYIEGWHDQAIAEAGEIISTDKYNTHAYYIRGAAHYAKKEYTGAIEDWNKAQLYGDEDAPPGDTPIVVTKEMSQDFVEVYVRRADLYYNQGKYGLALADWANARNRYYGFDETVKAKIEEAFNKTIAADPNDSEAYTCRGYIYLRDNQTDQAIEAFSKAIALKPGNADAYLGRGTAYEQMNQYREAIDDLTKAKELGTEYDGDFWRGASGCCSEDWMGRSSYGLKENQLSD